MNLRGSMKAAQIFYCLFGYQYQMKPKRKILISHCMKV